MSQPPHASGPPPFAVPPPSYVPWPHQELPYSGPAGLPAAPGRVLQRPAVVATACTLAVTASLQWVCALSFGWLVAFAAWDDRPPAGTANAIEQLFARFHERMLDGLAWPLYLFPLLSFTTGFLLLAQRPWTRWAHTLVGVAALGWSAWWLRDDLLWWLAPAAYIGVACAILWTPAANRWYRWPAGRGAARVSDRSA